MVTFDSTDLDNASSESGVVHESTTNTDHDNASKLKQGYSIANPYLSSNLVAYWPLQENSGSTAYDFSGNNNDGTINGAAVNKTGLLGTSSYSFDGTDDYVDTGYKGFGSDKGTSYTICFWLKTSSGGLSIPFGMYDGSGFFEVVLRFGASPPTLSFYDDVNGSNRKKFDVTGLNDGNWHYVVVGTTDANNTDNHFLFVDNTSKNNTRSDGSTSPYTSDFSYSPWFGARNTEGSLSSGIKANFYDFRLYSKALTSSERTKLYNVVDTPGTLKTGNKTV